MLICLNEIIKDYKVFDGALIAILIKYSALFPRFKMVI